jgi:hypothetical protein
MGFSNGSANKELLEELNFDMGAVIELLPFCAPLPTPAGGLRPSFHTPVP